MEAGVDAAWVQQIRNEQDTLIHQAEVIERQIQELCARDEFEKAEQMDIELRIVQHRLGVLAEMLPAEEEENEDQEFREYPSITADIVQPRPSRAAALEKAKRSSLRAYAAANKAGEDHLISLTPVGRTSSRTSQRDSRRASWQEIPLTPTPPMHKPRAPPPFSPRPLPPAAGSDPSLVASELMTRALSNSRILDVVFSFLTPEELGRVCAVSRFWRERIEQDELWHPFFRLEWQQEVSPSPGTFKRWYGAMRSASLSWKNPIVQQECVKHESFTGRVEVRTVADEAYLFAMSTESVTVWKYGSLQLVHEIKHNCAYALGGDVEGSVDLRIIGGDKRAQQWHVWNAMTGQKIFQCPADDGAFSGGWYVVYRNYLVVYRRQQQLLRGYLWNYETPDVEDIAPPMPAWETLGNFAMPKATRFGLLVTDFVRGFARVSFEDGSVTVLIKEKAEDLDPRAPRVKFIVDKTGMIVTRKSVNKSAPVIIYQHMMSGLHLLRTVGVPPGTQYCCVSDDLSCCFGSLEDEDGYPSAGMLWYTDKDAAAQPMRLTLELPTSRSRYLDSAICNNIVAGLFGDMLNPSELYLWEIPSGRLLSKLSSELGQRPYQLLRFTGLTACMIHKDGAITKLKVVGRRSTANEHNSGCTLQ